MIELILGFIVGFFVGALWLTYHTVDAIKEKGVILFGGKLYETKEINGASK